MAEVNTGGPAFPRPLSELRSDGGAVTHRSLDERGMTLRDYFAGQALIGYLAGWPQGLSSPSPLGVAGSAYEYADAMIAAQLANSSEGNKGGEA